MTSMESNSTSDPQSDDTLTWSFRTVSVLTVCSLITVLTLLGNGLVLISIRFRLRARSYSDYFIVSLCLADFFVGLFVMPPMTLHSLYLRWPFDYRLCYVWMAIDFTCSTASFLTLASMALDRYWALTAPYFHLRNRSYSSVLVFIISSWAIPFAIWPSSIFLGHYYDMKPPTCSHPAPPVIIVILCTFFYYIPLLFMLACYSRIIVNIKNIEVLIRGTWNTLKLNPSLNELTAKAPSITGSGHGYSTNKQTGSSSTIISLRSLFSKYFQGKTSRTTSDSLKKSLSTANERSLIIHELPISRQNSREFRPSHNPTRRTQAVTQPVVVHAVGSNVSSLVPTRRLTRQPTTATFTGHKRALFDPIDEQQIKKDANSNQDDEQQLTRARLSTRTSSLPSARCVSYYYYQTPTPFQSMKGSTAIIEDQHQDTGKPHQYSISCLTSLNNERLRSQSHSFNQCHGNGAAAPMDASGHSSSFDNAMDDEHRRLNHRTPPSVLSTSYNSSRYSQRAVAQFMHERHKARLRRNQKASRMLGILLAVFLVCWLPFAISYPTMVFYPNKFSSWLMSVIFWFGYVNSLLNPFLYVYSSRNFRQAIVDTLCCYVRLRSRQQLRYQWSLRVDHH